MRQPAPAQTHVWNPQGLCAFPQSCFLIIRQRQACPLQMGNIRQEHNLGPELNRTISALVSMNVELEGSGQGHNKDSLGFLKYPDKCAAQTMGTSSEKPPYKQGLYLYLRWIKNISSQMTMYPDDARGAGARRKEVQRGCSSCMLGKYWVWRPLKTVGLEVSEPLDCPLTLLLVSPGHSSFGLSVCE